MAIKRTTASDGAGSGERRVERRKAQLPSSQRPANQHSRIQETKAGGGEPEGVSGAGTTETNNNIDIAVIMTRDFLVRTGRSNSSQHEVARGRIDV